MTEVQEICTQVRGYDAAADTGLIERSFAFAAERHAGQKRRSGEPYVVHPLGVARIISELRLDVPSVCAGLLHDCVEDTSATAEDIGRLFGTEIQFLVEGVTKLGQIPWTTREERQAENFRKMLLAMARDIRVILIKLADRVDNMRTLAHMPRDKQERISRETMEIYAPLANRLGIQWMKVELEDLAFRYLEPAEHGQLVARLAETAGTRESLHHRGGGAAQDGDGRRRDQGPGLRPRQAPLVDLPEDEEDRARRGADLRRARLPGDHRVGARLLRGASASCTPTGRRFPDGSRTSSRCPSRTSTSRCTPP